MVIWLPALSAVLIIPQVVSTSECYSAFCLHTQFAPKVLGDRCAAATVQRESPIEQITTDYWVNS
jgi:hypothetical protein